MTQKEKQLLLSDLCARLPYNTHIFTNSKHHIRLLTITNDIDYDEQFWINGLYDVDEVKPYLRPMSSMTEEEFVYFMGLRGRNLSHHDISRMMKETFNMPNFVTIVTQLYDYLHKMDWLLFKHFDVRGLIPKGLAIEVTEENNPYKE